MGETNFIEGRVKALNNQFIIETALGNFAAALPANGVPWKTGEDCLLSVRPESWRLTTTAPASNGVAGRIRDCTYLGEMAQYQFAAAHGTLKIYELNPRFVDHGCDRDIFASVSPEDVVVLPR